MTITYLNITSKSLQTEETHTFSLWVQKQPSTDVLRKRCSENMQQIYSRIPMRKREITLRYGCSPVNLLHIFSTPFLKNTCGRLLMWVLILSWKWALFALKFTLYQWFIYYMKKEACLDKTQCVIAVHQYYLLKNNKKWD